MSDAAQVRRLQSACHEQWSEAKQRLEALGIEVQPWPGAGLVRIDVSELAIDFENPRVLQKQLRRHHPRGPLVCGDHVESFPLFLRHELEPGNYEDRKMLNPEETVREWVQRVANQIVTDCDACNTTRFFVRAEPTVGFPKGDDYGNWMLVLMLGAPSPIPNKLTVDNVEAQMRRLNQRSA